AGQLRQALAVVDIAADDRAKLNVRMLDNGRQDGRWPALALGPEWMGALGDAPAVVAAALDLEHHLPQVLADFASPQIARGPIEVKTPRLPQPIGPDFRPGAGHVDKRVIFRDAIRLSRIGAVHVDAEHRAEHVTEVLAGLQLVAHAAAVAGADVQ